MLWKPPKKKKIEEIGKNQQNEEDKMKIEIMAFDEKLKPLSVKTISSESNKAAAIAGETVELYLRRIDIPIKFITIAKEEK